MRSIADWSFFRACIAATTISTFSVLPLFLVGALGLQMSADLGFSISALGAASAAFYIPGALVSRYSGAVTSRIGVFKTIKIALLVMSMLMVTLGLGLNSLAMLLGILMLSGAANAVLQIAVNLYLAKKTVPDRQGTAYGIKQSAIPVAGLLAGIAVPVLGLTIGWRWAFTLFALPLALLAIYTPGGSAISIPETTELEGLEVSRKTLRLIALATGLAAGSACCLPVFLVSGAVAVGWHEMNAGIIFASSSGTCIIARLLSGIRADRRGMRHLETVAVMIGLGALGFFTLASGKLTFYPIGAAVAFGLGWGWPGVLIFSVILFREEFRALALALVQASAMLGGVIGPLVFGGLVEHFSFATAWCAAGAALLVAAVILLQCRERT